MVHIEEKMITMDKNRTKAQAEIVAKQKKREDRAKRVRDKARKIQEGDDIVHVAVDSDQTYNADVEQGLSEFLIICYNVDRSIIDYYYNNYDHKYYNFIESEWTLVIGELAEPIKNLSWIQIAQSHPWQSSLKIVILMINWLWDCVLCDPQIRLPLIL